MKACGVIAEYNPFHNGHRYQLAAARKKSQAEVMIVVMSGNFLQRGEPAIMDKWARTQAALKNGADLVIELPTHWSLQAADFFARGGVRLLASLQCDTLAFGTDHKETFDYEKFGNFFNKNKAEIDHLFKQIQAPELTYAQKMSQVLQKMSPELNFTQAQPNHILALTYAQENARLIKPMKMCPIKRIQASHNSTEIKGEIASATAIRKALQQARSIQRLVPQETNRQLTDYQVSWDNYWPFLRYRILSSSTDQLKQIYQMVEGLEFRLKSKILQAHSFTEYVDLVKSKRYTLSRIQRLLTYVLLDIRQEEMESSWQNDYLHLLGFTKIGQKYLQENKKQFELPLVSKFGRKESQAYALNVKADHIYQLGDKNICEQTFARFPIK